MGTYTHQGDGFFEPDFTRGSSLGNSSRMGSFLDQPWSHNFGKGRGGKGREGFLDPLQNQEREWEGFHRVKE